MSDTLTKTLCKGCSGYLAPRFFGAVCVEPLCALFYVEVTK